MLLVVRWNHAARPGSTLITGGLTTEGASAGPVSEEHLRRVEAAVYLRDIEKISGMTPRLLELLAMKGQGPPYRLGVGRRALYPIGGLVTWAEKARGQLAVQSTSNPGVVALRKRRQRIRALKSKRRAG